MMIQSVLARSLRTSSLNRGEPSNSAGIWWNMPSRHQAQIRPSPSCESRRAQFGCAHQHVRDTGFLRAAEHFMDSWPPHVAVDDQRPLVRLRQRHRQVARHQRLAFAGRRAGDHDGPRAFLGGREHHGRADGFDRFSKVRRRIGAVESSTGLAVLWRSTAAPARGTADPRCVLISSGDFRRLSKYSKPNTSPNASSQPMKADDHEIALHVGQHRPPGTSARIDNLDVAAPELARNARLLRPLHQVLVELPVAGRITLQCRVLHRLPIEALRLALLRLQGAAERILFGLRPRGNRFGRHQPRRRFRRSAAAARSRCWSRAPSSAASWGRIARPSGPGAPRARQSRSSASARPRSPGRAAPYRATRRFAGRFPAGYKAPACRCRSIFARVTCAFSSVSFWTTMFWRSSTEAALCVSRYRNRRRFALLEFGPLLGELLAQESRWLPSRRGSGSRGFAGDIGWRARSRPALRNSASGERNARSTRLEFLHAGHRQAAEETGRPWPTAPRVSSGRGRRRFRRGIGRHHRSRAGANQSRHARRFRN